MKCTRILVLASCFSILAISSPVQAKRICLMLCPVDSTIGQCKLTVDATGECNCKCRAVEWENIKRDIPNELQSNSLPSVALQAIDEDTIAMVPIISSNERFGLAINAKAADGGHAGGSGEKEKPQKAEKVEKLTAEEVVRAIGRLLAECQTKQNCN